MKPSYLEKIKNIPPIYCVTLESSYERRKKLEKEIDIPINYVYFKKYSEYNYEIEGNLTHELAEWSRGPVLSHLLINEYWLQNTNHEYVLIIEDDLSLETLSYWNFTWEDFINKLPEDWECIQLSIIRDQMFENLSLKFRKRQIFDYGAQIYLIKRSYAIKLYSYYHLKDKKLSINLPLITIRIDNDEIIPYNQVTSYNENTCQLNVIPFVENVIFSSIGTVYNIPLFVENIEMPSGACNKNDYLENAEQYFNCHKISHNHIIELWRNEGQYMTIQNFFI
jgi:GR25 family glycosyltransferase involved in LPS biosynthesis